MRKIKVSINLNLEKGSMNVVVLYDYNEVNSTFLLNRDFKIKEIIGDGVKVDFTENCSTVCLDRYNYDVAMYKIPKIKKSLRVEYTGYLSGKTGLCVYVKESINSEFTFLRWETFYYPIFAKPELKHIFEYLRSNITCDIEMIVPKEYSVLSPAKLLVSSVVNNNTISIFDCSKEMIGTTCTFSIAKYTHKKLPGGDFYILHAPKNDITYIDNILTETHKYMNDNFGFRDISADTKYVEIPNGYGSFAPKKCVYCVTDSFTDRSKIRQFIHEFIHLGWNALPSNQDQRIRFFDEAFTNYFTLRVLKQVIGVDMYFRIFNKYIQNYQREINEDPQKLVPISEFGVNEYGGLSYTIGALVLCELCDEVGQDIFDSATKKFLMKYKENPVTLQEFCEQYIKLCKKPALKEFFNKWIYSTECYEKYLKMPVKNTK